MPVLYRKYRPQRFGEIVAQEHVTRTLQNAFKTNQFAHAYLFAGPRGTGKTSVARILAKVVNCKQVRGTEPCGECDNCLAITRGVFLDLVEIDAASNRGIDDVRALREQVNFQPAVGKFRVYVLDEVHMLTKEAFNALLKTLEEPPAHAIFVLCTTEVHRLPVTVISRCQRFEFQLATEETLIKYLDGISKSEKLSVDEEALALIVEQARGSFRDALGLLEQVSSFAKGLISVEKVTEVLGLTQEAEAQEVLRLLGEGEIYGALLVVNKLAEKGKDLHDFNRRLLMLVRNKLQASLTNEGEEGDFSVSELAEMMELLQESGQKIKFAAMPQLPLEIAFLRFYQQRRQGQKSNRTTRLKNSNSQEKRSKAANVVEVTKNNPESGAPVTPVKESNLDLGAVWQQVMEELKPYNHSVHALLKGSSLEKCESGVVHLTFRYKFHKERIDEVKNRRLVEEVFSKVLGETVQVRCLLRQPEQKEPPNGENGKDTEVDTVAVSQVPDADALSEDDLIMIAQEILGGEIQDV